MYWTDAQKNIDKVLDSTYNPTQIRLNIKTINVYYNKLIKEVSKNEYNQDKVTEELRKIA